MMKIGIYRNPKPRGSLNLSFKSILAMLSLGEHQTKATDLTDLLPWAYLGAPGLVINKDGAFMKVYAYRGPDLDSSSNAQLVAARGQVNNALRRLGSGWCVHIEASRRIAPDYPKSSFPDPVSAAIDRERREAMSQQKTPSFETDFFMTFTYLPPEENIGRAEAALMENARKGDVGNNYDAELVRFLNTVDTLVSIFVGFMPMVRPLNDDETLSYLHDCISERPGIQVATPEIPFALDGLLRDTPLVGGLEPMLGGLHLRTVTVNAFPGRTTTGFLDAFNSLPFAYRWVTRFMPLDKQLAEKTISTMRKEWFNKRKGVMTLVKEGLTNQESKIEDGDAANKAAEAGAALEVLGADLTSFGYFTVTITVADADLDVLEWKIRSIRQVLDQQGLISMLETTNAVEAWLSSLPGHAYANCRRPLISALNVVDLMPFSAVWAGPTWNEHLKGPTVLMAKTSGNTPFRLSLHQGDVGHTMIIGPTGMGKSVLLNTVALQFRRYNNAQIFIFDKGASARVSTLLVGGEFYPLGEEADPQENDSDAAGKQVTNIAFQPLADIDDEDERIWAAEWLAGTIEGRGVKLSPELRSEIWRALGNLASRQQKQRTLTMFRSLVQEIVIKNALEEFTLEGAHGSMLDADHTNIGTASWQCFEMEGLYNRPSAIAPTLAYLFHKIESRFDGRPTLLILDEAWLFLDDPTFRDKIREWLKTLRRRNVSVVFASQQLSEIAESPISAALIENCPTRILLPNTRALEPTVAAIYEKFGLTTRQMQILSQATPKLEYYIQTASGNRLFELGLSRLAVTVTGSSSKNDLKQVDEIIFEHGIENFRSEFLSARGFDPNTFADVASSIRQREARFENA
jgi:type IV secretion/conjugal transfer VirB4 family ATPase